MKIPIFVGDIHGNAAAMTQILNYYNPEYYELYWLGDFVNTKRTNVDDREIEYVLHIMMEQCKNVLHSNHMHILYEFIHTLLFEKKTLHTKSTWTGWQQTMRVVKNLHPTYKRQLIEFMRKSKFIMSLNYGEDTYCAAHSVPILSTSLNVPSMCLTQPQKTAIGLKSSRAFWKQKETKQQFKDYKYVICGHHGLIARFGNIRICDLRGIQVPTFNPTNDTFKIFPL
jgi:hypothetical protein